MKSKVYIFLIIFMIIATFVVSSQNLVNAAPRGRTNSASKSKAKRAANLNKSSTKAQTNTSSKAKRAAVLNKNGSSNSKRIATTASSSSKKRALSRNAPKTTTAKTTTTTTTTTSTAKTTVCPVSTFIRKTYDEERDEYIFYSSKTQECTLPEDNIAEVVTWEKAKKDTYDKSLQTRPSWISEAETAFLTCIPGYVEKTVNKVKTCIIASGICPINDIVEKSGTTYKNPDTQDVCLAPEKAVVRNVKGDENLLSYTLADEKAYKFECPANYYPVEDVATSLKVKCEACPTGTSSTKGSSSVADCVGANEEKEEPEPVVEEVKEEVSAPAPEPEPAPVVNTAQLEEEAKRLAKLRIKKVEGTEDDYTCIDGWTNNWNISALTSYSFKGNDGVTNCYISSYIKFLRKPYIMDKDGKIKNVVDRNAYGKNKRGCPIKTDAYYYFLTSNIALPIKFKEYSTSNENCKFDLNPGAKDVFNLYIDEGREITYTYCSGYSSYSNRISPSVGILKKKIVSSDIDDTGVNGWTEEEYESWDGYKPILAYYYKKPSGKTLATSINCNGQSSNSSYFKISNSSEKYAFTTQSEDNLFKYWD